MPDASKSDFPSFWANAILDFEMTSLHPNFDSKSGNGENVVPVDRRFAGCAVLR